MVIRLKYLYSLQVNIPTIQFPTLIGESTPSYLLYGETVARRIHQVFPNVRLIVMLRDPVARAYSHYCMTSDVVGTSAQLSQRTAVSGKSFAQVVREDLALLTARNVTSTNSADCFQEYADDLPTSHGCHAYIGRGLYALQLELYLRVFSREQIHVIDLDEMKSPEGIQVILIYCKDDCFY